MKSPLRLVSALLRDIATALATTTIRDFETIKSRTEHEGLSFLTITLPSFCDGFERALDRGRAEPSDFPSFRTDRKGVLPVFLRGCTRLVFDELSGVILDHPSHTAVFAVRSLTRLFKKVLVECSDARKEAAEQAFKDVESELQSFDLNEVGDLPLIGEVADLLWGYTLGSFGLFGSEDRFYSSDGLEAIAFKPKHGPGATAEHLSPNERFRIRSYYQRNTRSFPLDLYAIPNVGWHESLKGIRVLAPEEEQPVRVVFVPKTLKTPRVIAIEPSHQQYLQQSVLCELVPLLERADFTKGHVNFTDQTVNQRLAKLGSERGHLATLDMKEASDRVSVDLVCYVFRSVPRFLRMLLDCRSTHACTPDGTVLPLYKFASMGSALCFPVESMIFFTLLIAADHKLNGRRPSLASVRQSASKVWVYGDDLVIPVPLVETAVEVLQSCRLKVNTSKSFWTGKFRESCGADYFDGTSVKPVYLRTLIDDERRHSAEEVLSLVSTANQFYRAGWWFACDFLRRYVEDRVGPLPHVKETSPLVGWSDVKGSYSFKRFNRRLHRFEMIGISPRVTKQVDDISNDSTALMMKALLSDSLHSVPDHYQSVRRGALKLKRHWSTPY